MIKDIVMIGHVCRDTLYDMGEKSEALGGAVYYSSIAAARTGSSVHVVTMAADADDQLLDAMRTEGVTVSRLPSAETTQITLRYESEDREKREVILESRAESFSLEGFLVPEGRIYHLAGLFKGEVPDGFIPFLSEYGDVAVDAQGVLRCSENGKLVFRQWDTAATNLPYIKFFKTDAAEAAFLTGTENREKAAYILAEMGAEEVMITHNEEVLVCCGGHIHKAPFNPANLSGRTGRGDTTFAAYLSRRLVTGPEEALFFAAALCSIKMESPGPFRGSVKDVYGRIALSAGKR